VSTDAEDSGHILNHHPFGKNFCDYTGHLGPQPTVIVHTGPPTRDGKGLTRKTATNQLDGLKLVCSDIRHVLVDVRVRPVPPKDGLSLLVILHLPHDLHPDPLKAKIEPAHTAEQ